MILIDSFLVDDAKMHHITEPLVIVHTIANHKFIRNEETNILCPVVEVDVSGCLLVERNTSFNLRCTNLVKSIYKLFHGLTRIIHIFDHQHVFILDSLSYFPNLDCSSATSVEIRAQLY